MIQTLIYLAWLGLICAPDALSYSLAPTETSPSMGEFTTAEYADPIEDAPEFNQPVTDLDEEIRRFEELNDGLANGIDPLLKNKGTWAYQFVLIHRDGRVENLSSYRTQEGIKPASTMKLFPGWMSFQKKTKPDDYLSFMLRRSDNARAEKTLGSVGGAKKMIAFYQNLAVPITDQNFRPIDGSGLSHSNRVTVELEVSLLRTIHQHESYDEFKMLLARPSQDGTLHGRFLKLPYPMFAKTGTLRDTTALAGFVELNQGTLIFSIISNHLRVSTAKGRSLIDQMVNKAITQAEVLE